MAPAAQRPVRYTARMVILTAHECRVLGVLVEKAQTTPGQYPMTLNGLISGCNQKSNRLPVLTLDEDDVLDALDRLRAKGLASEVHMSGSRVSKYKHTAREGLDIGTSELVIVTELMLRGAQTVGEIRGRATRMHTLDSLEIVQNILDHLGQSEPPMVSDIGAAPGSRATRYAHRLDPKAFDAEVRMSSRPAAPPEAAGHAAAPTAVPTAAAAPGASDLVERLARLEARVAALEHAARAVGSAD